MWSTISLLHSRRRHFRQPPVQVLNCECEDQRQDQRQDSFLLASVRNSSGTAIARQCSPTRRPVLLALPGRARTVVTLAQAQTGTRAVLPLTASAYGLPSGMTEHIMLPSSVRYSDMC